LTVGPRTCCPPMLSASCQKAAYRISQQVWHSLTCSLVPPQTKTGVYEQFAQEVLLLPAIAGRAPPSRAAPGAATTYTLETLLPGGGSMQVACAHVFSGADAAEGDDAGGNDGRDRPSHMRAGLTNGALRAAVVVHGDDGGVRLPAGVLPVQVRLGMMWCGG
jgi:prolyl-tRNA synthetase